MKRHAPPVGAAVCARSEGLFVHEQGVTSSGRAASAASPLSAAFIHAFTRQPSFARHWTIPVSVLAPNGQGWNEGNQERAAELLHRLIQEDLYRLYDVDETRVLFSGQSSGGGFLASNFIRRMLRIITAARLSSDHRLQQRSDAAQHGRHQAGRALPVRPAAGDPRSHRLRAGRRGSSALARAPPRYLKRCSRRTAIGTDAGRRALMANL